MTSAPDAPRDIVWTPRQREVLDLLACDYTNAEIAERLGVSLDGAKWHVSEVLAKLGVSSRDEAAAYWRQRRSLRGRLAAFVAPGWLRVAAAGAGAILAGGIVLLILAAAMDDDDDPAASETAAATSTAVSPSPTVPASTGRLIVLSAYTPGSEPSLWRVVVVDEGSGAIVHEWEIEDSDNFPSFQLLGDDFVATGTWLGASVHDLDGTVRHSWLPGANSSFSDFGLSPDGRTLALGEGDSQCPAAQCGGRQLRFVDVQTGAEVLRIGSDAFVDLAFEGLPAGLVWLEDGSGVVVRGMVFRDGHGSLALARLDGSLSPFDSDNASWSEPGSRFVAHHHNLPGGLCIQANPLVIADNATGEVVHELADAGSRFFGRLWSPDGSQLLVEQMPFVEGVCTRAEATFLLDPLTGERTPVADVLTVLRSWGLPSVDVRCAGELFSAELFSGRGQVPPFMFNCGANGVIATVAGVEVLEERDLSVLGVHGP